MDDDFGFNSLNSYISSLPTLLNLFSSSEDINIKDTENSKITKALGNFLQKSKILIYGFTFVVLILSLVGISKLEVENSFINYFDKETEIYKGMKKIDDDLGGTTPLNVIIKFPVNEKKNSDDEFSEWDEEESENTEDKSKYWFTRDKMDKILKVHDYLRLSARNWQSVIFWINFKSSEDLNKKELQSLEIAVLYSKIPNEIKKEIISPYISVEKDEARVSVRIKNS